MTIAPPDILDPDEASLREAIDWLRARLDPGEKCPCCTQFAKVYRRKINATMARTLITMHRHQDGTSFIHVPSLPGDTHEASQLVWWGLIEDEDGRRDDGGRAGWWRLTPLGRHFAKGAIRLPKYAAVYDSRCLRLYGDLVSIHDALGDTFNYRELMSA